MARGTEPLLRVAALRKTFGGLHALEDINLEVWPGEVVGLVGDNGAGKSTLVRCISGYYTPEPPKPENLLDSLGRTLDKY